MPGCFVLLLEQNDIKGRINGGKLDILYIYWVDTYFIDNNLSFFFFSFSFFLNELKVSKHICQTTRDLCKVQFYFYFLNNKF